MSDAEHPAVPNRPLRLIEFVKGSSRKANDWKADAAAVREEHERREAAGKVATLEFINQCSPEWEKNRALVNAGILYDERGRFIGEHGSPEHKAHIARVRHEQDVHDVIVSLIVLHDPEAAIEDRVKAAYGVDEIREENSAAYTEGAEIYTKAAAEVGLVKLRERRRPFNPEDSRIGYVFAKAPPAPPFVVDRLLPRSHGVENAIGGAGKTTRHIYEAVHLILGRALYGQTVLQPGPVLVVTKEDDLALFRHRVHGVVTNMEGLTEADRKRIAEHLHVLVLTGSDERLATVDRYGNLSPTDLADRIARDYWSEGLSLVEFDPFNMFGPGERFVNDGEAAALTAMARLSQELRCAVRATAHVSKAVGRDGTSDAHSGRGGSAAGDNSRFVWNYWRHDRDRDRTVTVPPELTAAADTGELYRLHVAKLTAARAAWERVWVVRRGFAFEWHVDKLVTPQERREAAAEADAMLVLAYLQSERAQGGYHTAAELEKEARTIGIGRDRVRVATNRLRTSRRIVDAEIPEEFRKGGRKTYLDPVTQPAPAPDTSRPIAEQVAG